MISFVLVDAFPVEPSQAGVLLVLKNKPDYLHGLYNLTGGKIEEGETIEEAAVRELLEEAGLDEVQDYDPMAYLPPRQCGVIVGTNSVIHCVQVPVSAGQALTPGDGETEPVGWMDYQDALRHPKLMPNLRLVIPLIRSGSQGWVVDATAQDWHGVHHTLGLTFAGSEQKITATVKGLGYAKIQTDAR